MKRVAAIDALRGVTIFAMILCAAISFDANLPAWMFHCQTPPPTYEFQPEVRGLTWVDLVFPFFIFSMGAAFPFALRRKMEKGESLLSISLGILKRGAILAVFAVVLGNADWARSAQCDPVWVNIYRLGVWLALFAALLRTPKSIVNILGWVAVAGLMAVQQFVLKVPLSIHHNDIIILLLSVVSVLGSFIWLLTRDSLFIRALVWIAIVIAKILGWDFPQYLIIAIPASIIGDIIIKDVPNNGKCHTAAAWIAIVAVVFQLWGLYTRNLWIDLCVTGVLGIAFLWTSGKGVFSTVGRIGFVLLIFGIGWDPIDGGLAKDYCNLSYLLVTGGQTALTLAFLMWCESRGALSKNLSYAGQNPMIAYTVGWFVLTPLLYLCGFAHFDALCVGVPLLGVVRGLIATFLTVGTAALFTKLKIFWKS